MRRCWQQDMMEGDIEMYRNKDNNARNLTASNRRSECLELISQKC